MVVNIDGDYFKLTIPSLDLLHKLKKYIDKCGKRARNQWMNHFSPADYFVVCEHMGMYYRYPVGFNGVSTRYLPEDNFENGFIRFQPILIPVDKDGIVDISAFDGVQIGESALFGSLYMLSQPVESFDVSEFPKVWLGDTRDDVALPWFRFGKFLVGAFTLSGFTSINGLFDKFSLEEGEIRELGTLQS